MSEHKHQNSSKNRMDKFLYYSKFGLLIIVALLFMIGYSFYQQDLPAGTAELQIDSSSEYSRQNTNILIVMDFESYYQADEYPYINLIDVLTNDIKNLDYDLLLLEDISDSATILDRINDSLLLRIYQKKSYDYIIAVGDNSIVPAKEIKELFLPKAQIFLYDVTNKSIYDAFKDIKTNDYTNDVMSLACKINPDAEKLLLIYNEAVLSTYSSIVLNTATEYAEAVSGLSVDIINIKTSSQLEVIDHINNQSENTLLFYISSYNKDDDALINEIHLSVDKLIYDLSPLSKNDRSRLSLVHYPVNNSKEPMAYIAISPEGASELNYEFIDYAIPNIQKGEYIDISFYISWCMDKISISDFPDTLELQYDYCIENSLFIQRNEIQPGDLIFLSNTENSNSINDVAIYVNDHIVLGENENGMLSLMQIKSEEFIVSFAHPYSLLPTQEN